MILASSTSDFVSYLSAGISEGSITALAALGFLLTHKATGVISFAQGAFVTLGAYIAVWASQDQGWPLLLADLFAIAAMFVVGVASERVAYRPLRGRSIHVVVIATFGISGSSSRSSASGRGHNRRVWTAIVEGNFSLAGAVIPWQRLIILVVTLFTVAAMVAAVQRHAVRPPGASGRGRP